MEDDNKRVMPTLQHSQVEFDSSQAEKSSLRAFLSLRERLGEGMNLNSTTTKQLLELNKINCHAEFISASSHRQTVTTLETQFTHGKISPVARFRNKFGMTFSAFTLAEVLITLGIIGVVAALTMPTLMSNYRKHVAETRLAKFYTTMNQAIQRAEVDYGDKKNWGNMGNGFETDEDGNIDKTKSIPKAWFDKYMKPYLNLADERVSGQGGVVAYFHDGSVAFFNQAGIILYLNKKDYQETVDDNGVTHIKQELTGTRMFLFYLSPTDKSLAGHYNKGIEPYTWGWDGTREDLFTGRYGCAQNSTNAKAYCTKLIQMNGWKIPKDYPLKF